MPLDRTRYPYALFAFTLLSLTGFPAAAQDEKQTEANYDRLQLDRPIFRPAPQIPFNTVRRIAFEPVTNDGTIAFYSAGDDKVVRKWTAFPDASGALALHASGIIRWPILQGDEVGKIYGLALGDWEGQRLLAFGGFGYGYDFGFRSGEIRLVDLAQGGEPQKLMSKLATNDVVYAIDVHPTLPILASCLGKDEMGRVALWKLDASPPTSTDVQSGVGQARRVRFSPTGDRLVIADRNGLVTVWKFDAENAAISPKDLVSKAQLSARIREIAWWDDNSWVAATEERGLVFGDAASGKLVDSAGKTTAGAGPTRVKNLTGAPIKFGIKGQLKTGKGKWAIETVNPGKEYAYDAAEDRLFDMQGLGKACLLRPGLEYEVRLTSDERPQLLNVSRITSMCAMPAAGRIATGVFDVAQAEFAGRKPGQLVLRTREASSSAPLEHAAFDGRISAIAASPDGKYLVAAGTDRYGEAEGPSGIVLRLWELGSGKLVAQFPSPSQFRDTLSSASLTQLHVSSAGDVKTIELTRGIYSPGMNRRGAELGKLAQPTVETFQLIGPTSSDDAAPFRGFRPIKTTEGKPAERPKFDQWRWAAGKDGKNIFWTNSPEGAKATWVGPFPIAADQFGEPLCAVKFRKQNMFRNQTSPELFAIGYEHGILIFDVQKVHKNAAVSASPVERGAAICRGYFGHEGNTTCLAADNPDNAGWLLSGSDDGTICAWSLNEYLGSPDVSGKAAAPKLGELGVEFELRENRLFVKSVDSTSPGFSAGFLGGQEIVGLARAGNNISDPAQRKAVLEGAVPGERLRVLVKVEEEGEPFGVFTRAMHEPLWTLYPLLNQKDWAIWSPEGYFDASEGCKRCMGWLFNYPLRFYSAKLSWGMYNQPRLFNDLLKDHDKQKFIDFQDKLLSLDGFAAHPTLSYGARRDDSGFDVVVKARRTGREQITGLQVWCNSRQICRVSEGPALENLQDETQGQTISIDEKYLRSEQENTFHAIVESDLDGTQLFGHRLLQRPRKAATGAKRKLHFLGIGVTKLDDAAGWRQVNEQMQPLAYSANDVAYLAMALGDITGEGKPFEAGKFRLLMDREDLAPRFDELSAEDQSRFNKLNADVQSPTHANIRAALEQLTEHEPPAADDLTIVLLTGHGFDSREAQALGVEEPDAFHFVTQDTDHQLGNSVTRSELDEYLHRLSCKSLLLIDACQSGEVSQLERALQGLLLGPQVVTSCKKQQLSREHKYAGGMLRGHGLFTAAVIEALTGKQLAKGNAEGEFAFQALDPAELEPENPNHSLSVQELCVYVVDRVKHLHALLEVGGDPQEPQIQSSRTFFDELTELKHLDD